MDCTVLVLHQQCVYYSSFNLNFIVPEVFQLGPEGGQQGHHVLVVAQVVVLSCKLDQVLKMKVTLVPIEPTLAQENDVGAVTVANAELLSGQGRVLPVHKRDESVLDEQSS